MVEVFKRKFTAPEIKWGYVYVNLSHIDFFPMNKPFRLQYREKVFNASMNRAHRVNCRDIVRAMNPRKTDTIKITKIAKDEFHITLEDDN
jgi:hypothetical protein